MDSYCSLFNYTLGIILIALHRYVYLYYRLIGWTILFFWLLIIGEKIEQSATWRQFVSFKWFVRPWTKFTSFSGIDILWIVYPLSRITLDVYLIIYFSQYRTLVLFLVVKSEFISGMMIPYLMYWTYDQMDVCFH